MRICIRQYYAADIPLMTRIWNEIVKGGNALPQEDCLTEETGCAFFGEQTYCSLIERRKLMSDQSDKLGEVVIYQSEDGLTHIDVKIKDETAWLTQQQLVDLYQTSKSNVSEYIKHIFEEGELDEKSVVRNFRTTASDGKNYNVTYYNLDMCFAWISYKVINRCKF